MICGELTRLIGSVFGGCHLFPRRSVQTKRHESPKNWERETYINRVQSAYLISWYFMCLFFAVFFFAFVALLQRREGWVWGVDVSRFQSQFNHIYQPMVGADSYYIWRFPESYPQSSSMFESDSQNGNHPANLGTGHGHGIRCFKLKIRSFPHHVPKKWHLGRSRNMSCAARSSFFMDWEDLS